MKWRKGIWTGEMEAGWMEETRLIMESMTVE